MAGMTGPPTVPVALVDASNQLQNLGRPLSKLTVEPASMPSLSAVPGRVGQYGEITRTHRSIAMSDAGMAFNAGRLESEVYPIPAPLCDQRGTFQIFGEPSRYDGRDPVIY
jgi:hypothetical protein